MLPASTSHSAESEFMGRWLLESALPFWMEQGFDHQGLAYEELGFDGRPKELGYRRSLVQFRQIYVLAQAALLGFGAPARPSALFHRVAALTWQEPGGFVHKLRTQDLFGDTVRESYDQAFGMLACARVYAIDRDSATLEYAYRTLRFLDDRLASPAGGYAEELGRRLPRRQNPHMHLLEALLALYEVTGDQLFRSRAAMIVDLLQQHFVAGTGALREYFEEDWRPAGGSAGEIVEPGHHFEWVWLLHEYSRLTEQPIHPLASRLFEFGTRHGLDSRGRPVEQVDIHGMHRRGSVKLWAVTERLKAHIARAEASTRTFDPAIVMIVRDMSEHFLLRDPPIWFEELAEDGTPSRHRMPASTLYHITLAAIELMRWQSHANTSSFRRAQR